MSLLHFLEFLNKDVVHEIGQISSVIGLAILSRSLEII